MHNPKPGTYVSPTVWAELDLILTECSITLHEKEENMYGQSFKIKNF